MKGLLVFLVVVALLAVAADRIAWVVAERATAAAIQRSENLAEEPDVDIEGVPFLTQAFQGDYRDVHVRITDLPAEEGLRIDELDGRLRGVQIPLSSLLDRSVSRAPVDSADATARVGFATLDAAAAQRIPSDQLTARFGPGSTADRVAVDGEYRSPVGAVKLKGEARLQIIGGALAVVVVPESLDVPAVVQRAVARLLGLSFTVPDLPFGFRPTAVQVTPTGVTLAVTGKDVVLGPTP